MKTLTNIDVANLMNVLNKIAGMKNESDKTIGEYNTEYEKYIEHNRSPKYLSSVKGTNKKMLNYFSPDRKLGEIKRKDIEALLEKFKIKAPKGYRVDFRNIKASFNMAVEWGYLNECPCNHIRLAKAQQLKPVFITQDEFDKIKNKIEIVVIRDIAELCFYTGLRLSEAVNLKCSNVNLKDKIITIGDTGFTSKTRTQRFVPMNEKVYQLLNSRISKKEKNKYVFAKNFGRPYTGDYISKKFKEAVRKAGLDEAIHYHTLRHSSASNLINKGVSLYTVQRILGHQNISTTQIYSHINLDEMRKAVNLL